MPAGPSESLAPREPRAKILVVDDNEANRLLAQSTLEDEDYVVVLANDGAEALVRFEADRPDCVLLDVRMPNIDGFTACARIRALPGGAETPILFLTAFRDIDTFDRALHAGGDDFLTKPIRPAELVVRVQSALELRRVKTELRDQFEVLKRQRDQVYRLQLQKERLTAFVVHDLKNPVNAMDLLAQLLLRDKSASPSVRESASEIRGEARRLTRLIMNLLDVSKADEGQLAPQKNAVDAAVLVGEVTSELALAAEGRKVKLESVVSVPRFDADPDLLRRVVTNLVENAIRYAPANTTITVTVAAADVKAAELAGMTEIRVADQGKGIPEEMRGRIFDAFVQADTDEAATRTSRGLGLSFCKSAVEAHGGRIWIEDGAPGTVFCLRLP